MTGADPDALVAAALDGRRRAIARLVTAFEDPRPEAVAWRRQAWAALDAAGAAAATGRVIGVTGAPGAGKSTLVGAVARAIVAADRAARVGILAIDPSSPITGGALLGDRVRIGRSDGAGATEDDERIYVRSQPSAAEPGGLGRGTYQAARLLARLFPTLLIETVGVGQGELEITALADRTYLVVTPHAGDELQFMKAGIMEVPDAFVVHKADLGDAVEHTVAALAASLRLGPAGRPPRPVHRTSARTGAGVAALAAELMTTAAGGLDARAPRFFERWVAREHGQAGLRRLATLAATTADYLAAHGGFDGALLAFATAR